MTKVYIAGPMTGIPDFNRQAFRTAAQILREMDLEVVCPADFAQRGGWEDLMKHAIPQMLSCDRVVLLGEWEKSRGARLEAFIARELGMKVETMGELILSLPTKALDEVRRECREKFGEIPTESVN